MNVQNYDLDGDDLKDPYQTFRMGMIYRLTRLLNKSNPKYQSHVYIIGMVLALGLAVLLIPRTYFSPEVGSAVLLVLDIALLVVGVFFGYKYQSQKKKDLTEDAQESEDISLEINKLVDDIEKGIQDTVCQRVAEELGKIRRQSAIPYTPSSPTYTKDMNSKDQNKTWVQQGITTNPPSYIYRATPTSQSN